MSLTDQQRCRKNKRIRLDKLLALQANGTEYDCDLLLSGADYHHTETLLNGNKQYSEKYWDKKTFAPSALLFFVGFDKKLKGLSSHFIL